MQKHEDSAKIKIDHYQDHNGVEEGQSDTPGPRTFLQKVSVAAKEALENFFFRWGFTVAMHPYKFITISLLATLMCATGLVNLRQEIRPDKLTLPDYSEFAINTNWIRTHAAMPIRENHGMITCQDNCLVPEVMKSLLDLHEVTKNVETKEGKKWNDVCFRLPITKFDTERKKRSVNAEDQNPVPFMDNDAFSDDFFKKGIADDEFESSNWENVPENVYCSVINSLDDACWETNPVELWSFDRVLINNLTKEEIINVFNHLLLSPVFGRSHNYTMELGGDIERNEKGEIIRATALLLKWPVKIDMSKEIVSDDQGQLGNPVGLEWELVWLDAMKEFASKMPDGVKLFFVNARSWGDISQATLIEEGVILLFGFIIMFIYVGVMLANKFTWIEQRPFLTSAGLSTILFSVIVSFGIGAGFSMPFTTLDRVLPFLLLGIGIDDMFVIMQCWNNLAYSPAIRKGQLSIPERMGLALKHAGVSITVTSITDVAAFGAGAFTILPSLRNFCIYASVGIIALFIFQCTFFVACFAIDQQRMEEGRNAYTFFCQTGNQTGNPGDRIIPSVSSKKSFLQMFFDNILSKYLLKKFSKVVVLLVTGGFLAIGVYGNTLIRQKFDGLWFLPENCYMVQFYRNRIEKYPNLGVQAVLILHDVNWLESLKNYGQFAEDIQSSPDIYNFMDWYGGFRDFAVQNYGIDPSNNTLNQETFNTYLGKYLYSPSGATYRFFFRLNDTFSCGDSVPEIKTVIVPFLFTNFIDMDEHLPAMHRVKSLIRNANLTFNDNSEGAFFYWAQVSLAWEVDEIIKEEMYRNLGLSLALVLVATLFLLADIKMCLFCGMSVILTITNVVGIMHFWGLTIHIASCTTLVLAIGLCIDYAAHICLAFMTCKGSKTSRAEQAVRNIGPAVFNGGFSTFLGVILLANAQTHAVESFFKIFTLVVFFGLYHGLIFLPVVLSLFGSDPYPFTGSDVMTEGHEYRKKIEDKSPKSVEMYPLSNGNVHATEIRSLNSGPEDNGVLSAKDPLLTHADSLHLNGEERH